MRDMFDSIIGNISLTRPKLNLIILTSPTFSHVLSTLGTTQEAHIPTTRQQHTHTQTHTHTHTLTHTHTHLFLFQTRRVDGRKGHRSKLMADLLAWQRL